MLGRVGRPLSSRERPENSSRIVWCFLSGKKFVVHIKVN